KTEDPTSFSHCDTVHEGERYHFCSEACAEIFEDEPAKYVQALLPVHQIYQGKSGGPELPQVLTDYYHINIGEDNFDYVGSPDEKRWNEIKGIKPLNKDTDAA
ncbi:MAG TPA: phenol 2-monooxygenase, partial [Glaciecola sp.]|nr:phenol 2-monooxygenase [Glaciecola sp.]